MTHDTDSRTDRTDPEEPSVDLVHVTIDPDDGPSECAIFPRDDRDDQRRAAWITAQDGSFVELESMR
ncbi:DUF7511 domain-containing protein [Natrialbaceae archaeon AArc-T1-2]|uniref:DUF7511 domain-containing protein n=1 Tax=Natrialbaceae archaeon AArc-T1-2 TaxID=3053904 RepID=UPI00255AFC6A|nr:hypothetical protein [Natrialbaceae archaeon AArc-T1-2]WIV66814.1 hypothetical protein QQ977_14130 [Natrialbaceae archaeon AArc-T1-2]